MNAVDKIAQDALERGRAGRGYVLGQEWVAAQFPDRVAVRRVSARTSRERSLGEVLGRVLSSEKAARAEALLRSRSTFTQFEQLVANADEVAPLFLAVKTARDMDVLVDQLVKVDGAYSALSRRGRVQAYGQAAVQGLRYASALPAISTVGDVPSLPPAMSLREVARIHPDEDSDRDGPGEEFRVDPRQVRPTLPDTDNPPTLIPSESIEEIAPLLSREAQLAATELAESHDRGLEGVIRDTAAQSRLREEVEGRIALLRSNAQTILNKVSNAQLEPALRMDAVGRFSPGRKPSDYYSGEDLAVVTEWLAVQNARDHLLQGNVRLDDVNLEDPRDHQEAVGMLLSAGKAALESQRLAALAQSYQVVKNLASANEAKMSADDWVALNDKLPTAYRLAVGKIQAGDGPGTANPAAVYNAEALKKPVGTPGQRRGKKLSTLYTELLEAKGQLVEKLAQAERALQTNNKKTRDAAGQALQKIQNRINDLTAEARNHPDYVEDPSPHNSPDEHEEYPVDDEHEGSGLTPDEDVVRMLVAQRRAGNTSAKLAEAARAPLRRLEKIGRIAPGHGREVLAWFRSTGKK